MDSYRWVLFKINLRDNKKNVSLNRSLTRWFWISPSASYSWTHSTSITGSPANCRAYQSLSFSSLACMSKFFQFCNIYLWVYCFIYQMISTLDSSPQNKAKKFPNDFINLVISKKNCVLNWIYANHSKVSLLICCITCILGPLLVRLSLLVSSFLNIEQKSRIFNGLFFLQYHPNLLLFVLIYFWVVWFFAVLTWVFEDIFMSLVATFLIIIVLNFI